MHQAVRHGRTLATTIADINTGLRIKSLWGPGEVRWPLENHLGTVRDVLDTAGNVVNRLRYPAIMAMQTAAGPR